MADQKTILIVDDEPDMVEWLKIFFEDNGYKTICAYDGVDGFEKAERDKPDLISLDITMDKESGIKMFRKLQESDKASKIPVVILTGVSPDLKRFIDRTRQLKSPDAFFEKPVDKDALLAKVRELTE